MLWENNLLRPLLAVCVCTGEPLRKSANIQKECTHGLTLQSQPPEFLLPMRMGSPQAPNARTEKDGCSWTIVPRHKPVPTTTFVEALTIGQGKFSLVTVLLTARQKEQAPGRRPGLPMEGWPTPDPLVSEGVSVPGPCAPENLR